jgi:uncharacterized membrane protein
MRVEERIVVDAPPEVVWDLIADPELCRRVLKGVTRWEVAGEQAVGLGARYAMRMKVGSAEVGGLVEVVEFDELRDMAWTSVTGLDHRGRWRLREHERGGTTVSFRLAYQAPGGLLATIADRVSAPMVRGNLRRSLVSLKAVAESGVGR